MQFKTLLLASTLALTQTALAGYNVANCGKATNMDGAATKAACNAVGAEVCDRTGTTRCIVEEGKFGAFEQACKKEGEEQVYKKPGAHDHFTATRLAGCL
jgi:hypothetical protein